jgi:DNA-binding beta-propeller fold protein YncE
VAPYSYSWNTSTVTSGTYELTAVARDTSNNTSESIAINVIVAQGSNGLVAAWGFETGIGLNIIDASGNDNTGTISGAVWDANGRFGNALSFDGINDWVTVADADSLDLTAGMTLEAWVYPTVLSNWRTVLMKEITNELAYTLYAHDNAPYPSGLIRTGGTSTPVQGTDALPLNTWTHLALTYDGALLRLYENGIEIGTQTVAGNITISTEPLRIGGNAIWGEYFSGRIDEVRIYNRPLDAAEIQINMNIPVVTPQPTRSSPIIVDQTARRVWLVNPDNNSVAAIGADSLLLEQEIPVGLHPSSIALDKLDNLWVTCRDDDSVWVLNAANGTVNKVLTLPWGSAPEAIVFSPNGLDGYISATGSGLIQQVDAATQALAGTLNIGATPRALAITADGQRMLVTQFITTDNTAGTVRSVDLAGFTVNGTLSLPLDTNSVDGSLAARGLPNYLASIAIHPQNNQAWIATKKDNILRGLFRDGQPLTFETSIRSMIGLLNLDLNVELTDRRVDIDNHGQPSAIAISESGEQIFITLQGNNRLIVLNQLGAEITRVDTGLAPQGVAIDPVSMRVFTKDLMSRTVSIFDASGLITAGATTLPQLAQVQTVTSEQMSPAVLQGKQIFYNAADPRMAKDGYISCATCHLDGGHDGRVWDFTDRGEGLRNTITLNGQGGTAGAPLHWTGNFDEVQDFENDIRNAFAGTGFMDDADFIAGTRSDPLGDPKAGISPALDALAAYVDSLTATGRSPHRQADGTMTPDALAGKAIFESLSCPSCHSGVRFSDSNTGLRHDVGTIKPSSGQRIGTPLDGFDAPMLPGLWTSAPYLHDGSTATLQEVLTTANPDGQHDSGVASLPPAELSQLIEYLLQIELP